MMDSFISVSGVFFEKKYHYSGYIDLLISSLYKESNYPNIETDYTLYMTPDKI